MSTSYADFNTSLIADLRANGGRPTSGPFLGRDVLILTTTGAKSGETRETPLVYMKAGENFVVIASKGGAPSHPAWYHNLSANPGVTLEVLGKRFQARARAAVGEEYESLYKSMADRMPAFWDYRKKTTRTIPAVVLEPQP